MNEIYCALGKRSGRKEAWEAARKIILPPSEGGLSSEELREIFGYDIFREIFRNYDVTKAIDRIKEYEDRFKIGDEIIKDCSEGITLKGIVTRIEGDSVYIMWSDGSSGSESKKRLKKTGENYSQINEILDQLKIKKPKEKEAVMEDPDKTTDRSCQWCKHNECHFAEEPCRGCCMNLKRPNFEHI